ncbi:MAG: CapA family protein [Coriobacteriales bacterium]|nr:CapA family protein [Coriobacteriales bacterium]
MGTKQASDSNRMYAHVIRQCLCGGVGSPPGRMHTRVIRRMRQVAHLLVVFLLTAMLALSSGCAGLDESVDDGQSLRDRLNAATRPFDGEEDTPPQAQAQPSPTVQLDIVAAGDIMLHYPNQVRYDSLGNAVFGDYFQFVTDVVSAADLAICNIEAPFGGGEPSGYPIFNMADEMAPAVAAAGFDVAITTNNHMLDQYAEGVLRSVRLLRENGLLVAGSRLEASEPGYALYSIKGLRIAVVAYTYETSALGGNRAINGLPMSEELDPLINSYTSGSQDDKAEIVAQIEAARSAGADLVISYFHNGIEYSQQPSDEQREMAQLVADAGADIIFASHPHVLQPMELLEPTGGGTPVPVYWAMGNYISNQRLESGMDAENEQGILANVQLSYNTNEKQVTALTMDYLPLWVDRYHNGERTVHTTIAQTDTVADNPALAASGHLERALAAFEQIRELLGPPLSWSR